MDSSHSILRSAKFFFAGTLLSRFSGLARDMAMAFFFGSAPEVAGFMVAYRLAYVFRRLFGEGTIQAGFVPHFEQLRSGSNQEAALFYRDMAWSLGISLLILVAILETAMGFLRPVLGSDWQEIASLAMWMIPGLFFLCLFALHGALLQCQKKTFWAAAAPLAFNAAWIAAAFTSKSMTALALGVGVGCAVQWLVTAFQVRKELALPWSAWFRPRLFSSDWKQLLKPMTLGIIGVGAVQINSALDAIFARFADLSGPAYLWYAIRVEQLPLALFGIALSGALLPPLARVLAAGDTVRYRELLQGALQQSLTLMLPCTFGIFALASSGLNLLYGRGDFSQTSVAATTQCLWAYGLSLIPSVFVLILAQGFFARRSYATPTKASLLAVAANIALNALLVFGLHFGAASIAIATSASAWINCWVLARALDAPMPQKWGRLLLACALPASLVLGLDSLWPLEQGLLAQLSRFALNAAMYAGGVLGLAKTFGVEGIFELFQKKAPET